MTLEELKNKKVTITVNKTFVLGDDIPEDILEEYIDDQGDSDEELLKAIVDVYYSIQSDLENVLDMSDYKITIHD